jgi:signal peptidase I
MSGIRPPAPSPAVLSQEISSVHTKHEMVVILAVFSILVALSMVIGGSCYGCKRRKKRNVSSSLKNAAYDLQYNVFNTPGNSMIPHNKSGDIIFLLLF